MSPDDAARFRYLYETYSRHVFAFCRRRVRTDLVDDLVADVFLTVWRRIADVPTGDAELGWLYKIAYHAAGNYWRGADRQRKLESKLESIGMQTAPLIQDQIVVREEVRLVLSAAERLRERDFEVLRLALWEDLTSEAIGLVLDVSPNAARQRLHRARKNLEREVKRISHRSVTPAARKGGKR